MTASALHYLEQRALYGVKFGLEAMHAMCAELGQPERACPALLVAGTKDSIFPAAHMQKIKNGIPHATLRLIPGGNHVLVLNSPEILAQTIASWLLSQKHQGTKQVS